MKERRRKVEEERRSRRKALNCCSSFPMRFLPPFFNTNREAKNGSVELVGLRPYEVYRVTVSVRDAEYDVSGQIEFRTAEGVFTNAHPYVFLAFVTFETAIVSRIYIPEPWPGRILNFVAVAEDPDGQVHRWNLSITDPLDVEVVQPSPDIAPLFVNRFRGLQAKTVYNFALALRTGAGLGENITFTASTREGIPLPPEIVEVLCTPGSSATLLNCIMRWEPPSRPSGTVTAYEVARGVEPDSGLLGTIVHTAAPTTLEYTFSTAVDDRRNLRVRAISDFGPSEWSNAAVIPDDAVTPSSSNNDDRLRILVSVLIVALLVLVLLLCLLIRQRRAAHRMHEDLQLPAPDKFEVDPLIFSCHKTLGAGTFGVVSLAYATGLPNFPPDDTVAVAVKTCNTDSPLDTKRAFLAEAELMKSLPLHENVVALLGVCLQAMVGCL